MVARRHRWAGRLLDLAVYAVGMTVLVAVALVPPSLLAGAGLVGVKYGLFLVGVAAFGYATLLLWPSPPGERSVGGDSDRGTDPGAGPSGPGSGRRSAGNGRRPAGNGRRPAGSVEGGRSADSREETRFEALVGRVPPLAWYPVPLADRFHPGAKLYVTSVLMLAVSYAMEVVIGIRA